MNIPPEHQEKVNQMKQALPKMKKDVADFKRLHALAKQSPFASANSDFLERMELEWRKREGDTEMTEMILKVVED